MNTTDKIMELVAQYWDLAYAEGAEGREHDTEAGDAGYTLHAIKEEIEALALDAERLRGVKKVMQWYETNRDSPVSTLLSIRDALDATDGTPMKGAEK